MAALLGLYMKSQETRAVGSRAPMHFLDYAATTNLRELLSLFRDGDLRDSEALVKWQRQRADQPRQSPAGRAVPDVTLWQGTRQFLLSSAFASGIRGPLGTEVSGAPGVLTTGESIHEYLQDFYQLRRARADARTAIVFWGHGDGPGGVILNVAAGILAGQMRLSLAAPLQETPSSRQFESLQAECMDLFELESAFQTSASAEPTPVDMLCFDACQDATIELATVLRPFGRLMVANQSGTPILEGWPFAVWPKVLDPQTFPDDRTMAAHIVSAYSQIARSRNVISVIALDRVEQVMESLGALSTILLTGWADYGPVLVEAASAAACPPVPNSYADKRDMIRLFGNLRDAANKRGPHFQSLAAAADAVVTATREMIINRSVCGDSGKYGYNGISIYLPDGSLPMSPYASTIYSSGTADFGGFKTMTRWDEVVSAFGHA